jgi:hypothetical protein
VTTVNEQLLIVQKYEAFLHYFYPVAQNLPRKHGVAKEMFLRDMLGQVDLFIVAGKTRQISRLQQADAGLAMLRFWLRFLSGPACLVITEHQHRTGSIMLAEVGKILGAWIMNHKSKADPGKV